MKYIRDNYNVRIKDEDGNYVGYYTLDKYLNWKNEWQPIPDEITYFELSTKTREKTEKELDKEGILEKMAAEWLDEIESGCDETRCSVCGEPVEPLDSEDWYIHYRCACCGAEWEEEPY